MSKIFYILGAIIVVVSPFLGDFQIEFKDIFQTSSQSWTIFWDLRVPRVVLGFFCGSILALSGLLFQTIFKNDLITPYTLGVASGSTFFTALFIVFAPTYLYVFGGFFGSLFTIITLFLLSNIIKIGIQNAQTNSILLIGIALSFFYSACLMFLFAISNLEQNYSIVRFTLGSLDVVGYKYTFIVFVFAFILYFVINFYKKEIMLLSTSNDNAFLKGIEVKRTNITLLVVGSICVGATISVTGPIGFIGLIVPHAIRLIYKESSYKLFLPIFYFGGVFLVLCDLISRNIVENSTIPIGVITSFIGAPFFIYLIIKKNR